MWRFSKFDFGRVLMRASVAGLLAACALFGIPRLVGELREYRQEMPRPAPLATSVPSESRPAASAAPIAKAPGAPVMPRQAPMQLISLQRDPSPPSGAVAKPANPPSPANEAELIPAIQQELIRLGLYDGPVTDKWSRPVRGAVREYLRKTGSPVRHPQPAAELLAALKTASPVKKPAASPPESARPEEKPIRSNGPAVKETPPKQSVAAPAPPAENDDYLPPWMRAKTDQTRFAANTEAARSDGRAEVPPSIDEAPKRHFHRRRHAERTWQGRRHYGGYYSRRRTAFFPF
jgi:hypothetical protein